MNKKEFLQKRLNGIEYIQPERCALCKNCCICGSCSVLPMDIEPFTVENVMSEIKVGKYSVSLEVLPNGNIFSDIHVRECGSNIIDIYKPHTKCDMLKENGCSLSKESRPIMALAVVPGFPCRNMISDKEYFQMWLVQQHTMEQVVKICSEGKSPLQLMLEHFDKVAMEIYGVLLNKTIARDYSDSYMASVVSGENLYEKIIRISNSQGTTDRIIERLVDLESNVQTFLQDSNGHNLAKRMLRPYAYRMLDKHPLYASSEEKIAACLKYNKMYV